MIRSSILMQVEAFRRRPITHVDVLNHLCGCPRVSYIRPYTVLSARQHWIYGGAFDA